MTGDLPRPDRIWVYNFVATPADLPANSEFREYDEHTTPQTDEEIATGRELGGQIAGELVRRIREMGVPAERGSNQTRPKANDIVIRAISFRLMRGVP